MIEAYEVGVSLVMSDSILASLSLVNSKLLETQQFVMGSNAALRRMDSLTKTAASSANGLATAMGRVASAAKAAASGMAGMNASGGGGSYGGYSNERTPRQRSGQVFTPYGLLTYNPPPMPVSPGNLPATIPGNPYYSGDTGSPNFRRSGYVPNWMPGSGGSSSGEDAKMSNPERLELRPKSAKKPRRSYYGYGGHDIFAEGMGAYFGYSLLKTTFGDAGQIDAVKANMLASGFTPAQVTAAYAEADRLRQQIPGTSNLENLKEILFLKARFGSVQEAMDSLPDILKQGIVVTAASGGGIDYNQWLSSLNENLEAMARAGEISGKLVNPKTHQIDPSRLATFTKNMADLALASGGVITPQDLLALSQNAGPGVVSQLSDPALFGDLAPIILSMGGERAGTALNALAMQFKGGKMNQYNARAMHDIGLLPDYMFGKDGKLLKKYRYGIGRVEIPAGALADQSLYNKSPGAWLMQVLLPHLEAHGYTTVQEQQNYMYRLLSRTTGIRGMQDLITNLPQIEKYYAAQQAQQKQDNYQTIVKNNPLLQAESLNAAFSAFMSTSGQTWMPQAIKMINGMTDFMNAAGKLATKHPHITSLTLDLVGVITAFAGLGFAMGVLKYALKPVGLIVKTLKSAWTAMDWIGAKVLAPLDGIITRSAAQIYKFFGATLDFVADLAAGDTIAIAAIAAFGEVVATIGAVVGAVYALNKALDWVDKKLDGLFGIDPNLQQEAGVEAKQWVRAEYDKIFGIKYKPDYPYAPIKLPDNWGATTAPQLPSVRGSLAPNAATPPPPQRSQQNGPIPVHVTNPGDIHNGTAKAMIHQLAGRMNGPTGFDYTLSGIAPAGAY